MGVELAWGGKDTYHSEKTLAKAARSRNITLRATKEIAKAVAPAAYLKDIAYILPVALFFLWVPFHFIATIELFPVYRIE
jgi:hypothetical protein